MVVSSVRGVAVVHPQVLAGADGVVDELVHRRRTPDNLGDGLLVGLGQALELSRRLVVDVDVEAC
jgi:hypothetical protein